MPYISASSTPLRSLPPSASSAKRAFYLGFRSIISTFYRIQGRFATPYCCWTISLSVIDRRKTNIQQYSTAKQSKNSELASFTDLKHYTESAQAIPKWQIILLSARGGQRARGRGRVIGAGKMTVHIGTPISVLKIERTYPTIVAVFAELMNIWKSAAMATCAIAQPMKTAQRSSGEVCMKKSMSMMQVPATYMMVLQAMLIPKLTMKKLTQQHRISKPFIFIISNCRSSFQDTSMQSSKGSRREIPRGQRPDPMTFTILLTNVLSSPENGMYIIDPEMTSLGLESMRKGRVTRSTSEMSPSVTLRYVLMVVVSDVFMTILVTPLFLWYQGSLKSLIANAALKLLLSACLNLMMPSGMSVLRSSPRSKFNLSARWRQAMIYAFAESTFTIFGESDPSGQTSFICIPNNFWPAQAEGEVSKQYNCWQLRPSCGLMTESTMGILRGCGQSMDQTAPVVIPATICLTASVKRRQRMGLTAWHAFEQQFLDWRVMLFLKRACSVAEADPFFMLLEEWAYNSNALLVICSCGSWLIPSSCSLSIMVL